MNTSRWALRLFHEGRASIRLERPGRWLWFDPLALPPGGAALVSWLEMERAAGVRAAAAEGRAPEVVASAAALEWLGAAGHVDARDAANVIEIDGVRIESAPYTPIPWATPAEAARKVRGALRHPLRAADRLRRRPGRPSAPPLAWRLSFPDGATLVHLGCALNSRADRAQIAALQDRWGGADWLICGVDYGEEDSVIELLPGFRAGRILLADLLNQTRAEVGMPTSLLTPVVDQLVDRGVAAHPFAPGSSFRFESSPASASPSAAP